MVYCYVFQISMNASAIRVKMVRHVPKMGSMHMYVLVPPAILGSYVKQVHLLIITP